MNVSIEMPRHAGKVQAAEATAIHPAGHAQRTKDWSTNPPQPPQLCPC